MTTIDMAKTGARIASIAAAVLIVLFLTACGLKDDLYIPDEESPDETVQVPDDGNGESTESSP